MNIEKTGLLTLVAVLAFGLSASPIFQNYVAYAQTDEESIDLDEMDYEDRKCWKSDDGSIRCEYHDRECWEADDGTLRCEGHDGQCFKTDDGAIHCERHHMMGDMKMHLDKYCEMTDEEKEEKLAMHPDMAEHHERMNEYCNMSEEEREEYRDEYQDMMMDFKERYMMGDMKMHLDKYCEMTDEEKEEKLAMHPDMAEHHERMNEYCNMSEEEREEYRDEYQDMMMDMKEYREEMMDEMKDHMDDNMLGRPVAMPPIDFAGEGREALMEKFRAMHGALTDEQKQELHDNLKSKYMEHYKMKVQAKYDSLSEEDRNELRERYEEMKEYKMELRLKYDTMTDAEKAELKDEFLAKAKEKRLAWISPLKQMVAGIDVDEIECREGFNLVIKNSNGVALCLKSSTAENLIERGIVVPSI